MVAFTLEIWKTLTPNAEPIDGIRYIQRAWDTPVAQSAYTHLQTRCDTPADTARLKAIAAPHADDWLNAPPITTIGLRLSDEAIRVGVGFRLGCVTCHHTYASVAPWSTLEGFMVYHSERGDRDMQYIPR